MGEQLLKEVQNLSLADECPQLIKLHAGFVGQDNEFVHVVIEFMDLGSLADLRRRAAPDVPPADHVACIAAQMTFGLHYLQQKQVLHRDVKPENILHNLAGQVKLTDFGISKSVLDDGVG